MNHGSLFTGIGGFDITAEWMGWTNVFQVEKDKFCQKLLVQNFPNVKKYEDIKKFNGTKYRGAIDIISGGFPCQPFSISGKRKGKADDRYLWPEMLRVIKQIRPPFLVIENVTGIIQLALAEVLASLENEGYCNAIDRYGKKKIIPVIIPACAVNAPHQRNRVWIIAYSDSFRQQNEQKESGQTLHNKKRHNQIEEQNGKQQQCRAGKSNSLSPDCNNTRVRTPTNEIYKNGQKNFKGDKSFSEFGRQNYNAPNTNGSNEFNLCGEFRKKSKTFAIASNTPSDVTNPQRIGQQEQRQYRGWSNSKKNEKKEANRFINGNQFKRKWFEVATRLCRVDDGVPHRVDRIKALGNAIVPQVAYEIFKNIEKFNKEIQKIT